MLPLPAGREASAGVASSRYERHRPERTLLYQLVEEHYPALKVHLARSQAKWLAVEDEPPLPAMNTVPPAFQASKSNSMAASISTLGNWPRTSDI